jgi:hypothetical protein
MTASNHTIAAVVIIVLRRHLEDSTIELMLNELCSVRGNSSFRQALEQVLARWQCERRKDADARQHNADHIDGYDRDDLGESPDY